MNLDQDQLINCSRCDETPCSSHRLFEISVDFREDSGNYDKYARVKLHKKHIREKMCFRSGITHSATSLRRNKD